MWTACQGWGLDLTTQWGEWGDAPLKWTFRKIYCWHGGELWSWESSKQGTDMRVEGDSVMASSFWAEGGEEEGPPTAMRPNADAIGVVRFFLFKYWEAILGSNLEGYSSVLGTWLWSLFILGNINCTEHWSTELNQKKNGSCIVLQIHPHYLNNVPHYAVSFISKECSTWPSSV